MMDLKGMLTADAVTRIIPNLLRSGGGQDVSWLGGLYEVMQRDAPRMQVDLFHANFEFVFESVPEYEPQGIFVEVGEAFLRQV